MYLTEFVQGNEEILSVSLLYRALGWLGGVLVMTLSAAGITVAARNVDERLLRPLRSAALLVYFVYGLLSVFRILYVRYLIPRVGWIRTLFLEPLNYSDLFLYVIMALALVVVVLALRARRAALTSVVQKATASIVPDGTSTGAGAGTKTDGKGSGTSGEASTEVNAAQVRKARAAWRSTRRWATVVAAGFVIAALSFTAIKAYDEQAVELAPAEPMEYVGVTVRVSLETINDGHLHRFAHTTKEGVEVRFIVIQKNETSYGVGLDACEICGSTGYYERDNEVVCIRCDVVMNKQTIGFPGGCNPIPLAFQIGDGYLVVNTQLLEEAAVHFK
jgi:hypothetical protein